MDFEKDVLFVGLGASAVAWYRCFLPALFLGSDWAGLAGEPDNFMMPTGLVKRQTQQPRFEDYKVVILQQPRGRKWLSLIGDLQKKGIVVLYEVDDYLHSIRKQEDHDFKDYFDKKYLADMELCMRVCDGLICSTDFIARRYRTYNKNTFVCENGIDCARYRLTLPERPTVNIGWAGATAHARAVGPWLDSVARVMAEREEACFVTIGQAFANVFQEHFGSRAIATPWTLIESYPAAMTMFDIALGPAGKTNFFRGKSDLRWLEAGALGVPIIASPVVYPKIEHGVTGFHAEEPEEAEELLLRLVEDEGLRTTVGRNAKAYVEEQRDMKVACLQWAEVVQAVVDY